jgi:hypothetical protein
MEWRRWLLAAPVVVGLVAIWTDVREGRAVAADWRTASREPTGIAPDPAVTREAVAQVYIARTFGWRGYFGAHSWIAVKPTDAPHFTVYEVIGWRHYRGLPALAVSNRAPDARWFGNAPEILYEVRGEGADEVIAAIDGAARGYPYANDYRMWPGPNSNTFVAHVAREVPALRPDFPATAIGKDFLTNGGIFARAPSGTGYQVSLWGLFGVLAAREEGLEINLLGLTFGIDPLDLALKLPGLGRIGFFGSNGVGDAETARAHP